MRRGSMELSVNTIVVMAIGIVLIVGGMSLVWKIAGAGVDIQEQLTGGDRQALEAAMNRGELVAISPAQQTINAGDGFTFGVGILNRLDDDTMFKLEVRGQDAAGNEVTSWGVRYFETIEVNRNDYNIAQVTVIPDDDAPQAEYTFTVKVSEVLPDETLEQYGNPTFFIVRVV